LKEVQPVFGDDGENALYPGGSFSCRNNFVNEFTGTGKVLIAPVANRYITMTNYLGSIYLRVLAINNS
jgi:hypothetical protein